MSAEFKYDVFLSHNHADKPKVRRLAERLKAALGLGSKGLVLFCCPFQRIESTVGLRTEYSCA